MKRFLLSLVLAMCLWPSLWAEIITGSCGATSVDKVTYSYNTETCHLVIEGKGAMGDGWKESVDYTSVKTAEIKEGITDMGERCFEYCSSLTSISLPDGITSMGDGCFYNCSSLTSISLPDGITDLGISCFFDCSSLTSISLPDGITSMSNNCFSGCSSLTSISLPDGITSLGDECFSYCYSLTTMVCHSNTPPSTPPSLSYGVFSNVPTHEGTLYVPQAAISAYRNDAEWAVWNMILPIEEIMGIESLSASRGVIASCHDGLITLTGLNNNERVQFYSINGVYLGACNATDGGVQFAVSQSSGYVIAKVGTHSLRIAVR